MKHCIFSFIFICYPSPPYLRGPLGRFIGLVVIFVVARVFLVGVVTIATTIRASIEQEELPLLVLALLEFEQ